MKRFTSIEIGALILAALLFFTGLDSMIWPREGVVVRPTNGVRGAAQWSAPEVVTKSGARVYGGLSMLFGIGIGVVALYRKGK